MPNSFNDLTYEQLKQEAAQNLKQRSQVHENFLILPKSLPSLPKPISLSDNNFNSFPDTDRMIGLDRADLNRPTGKGFTAVLIDSGVYMHDDLKHAITHRLSVVKSLVPQNPEDKGEDKFGHGTHLAGIIAAKLKFTGSDKPKINGMGIAPDAKIISIKVTDSIGGNATWSSIHKALLKVIAIAGGNDPLSKKIKEEPIRVVNLSFNGIDCLQANDERGHHKIFKAIEILEGMKIPVVISGGNAYRKFKKYGLGYPACNDTSINVGSQFNFKFDNIFPESLATFSQRLDPISTEADEKAKIIKTLRNFVVAPGVCSVSLGLSSTGHKYSLLAGTSCSAAIVSACILILQEYFKDSYPDGIPVKDLKEMLLFGSEMDPNNKDSSSAYPDCFDSKQYPSINLFNSFKYPVKKVIPEPI